MSGFQKRVALLEKWAPNLVPKLKDIDDLADIILDVWDEAEAHTEERIINLLEDSRERTNQRIQNDELSGVDLVERVAVYKTLGNVIALIKGENK